MVKSSQILLLKDIKGKDDKGKDDNKNNNTKLLFSPLRLIMESPNVMSPGNYMIISK